MYIFVKINPSNLGVGGRREGGGGVLLIPGRTILHKEMIKPDVSTPLSPKSPSTNFMSPTGESKVDEIKRMFGRRSRPH